MILAGSGTKGSRTLGLGKAIAEALSKQGAEVQVVDLLELGLPTYDHTTEKEQKWDDKTRKFLDDTKAAGAFVWVTPIYHNSFSGLLKNALDWQHMSLDGKIVAMASHGGDRSPQAVDQLLIPARAQHLVAVSTRVCTDNSDYDDQKKLSSEAMIERVNQLAIELLDFAKRHAN